MTPEERAEELQKAVVALTNTGAFFDEWIQVDASVKRLSAIQSQFSRDLLIIDTFAGSTISKTLKDLEASINSITSGPAFSLLAKLRGKE